MSTLSIAASYGQDQFEEFDEEYSPRIQFDSKQASLIDEIDAGCYSASEFVTDIKMLVQYYVDFFFADRHMHCGGKIPKRFLHDPHRISQVLNLTLIQSVDMVYTATEPMITEEENAEARRTGEATWDIRLVNESLKTISLSGVPQDYAGGILLMYLELCEGINIEY